MRTHAEMQHCVAPSGAFTGFSTPQSATPSAALDKCGPMQPTTSPELNRDAEERAALAS